MKNTNEASLKPLSDKEVNDFLERQRRAAEDMMYYWKVVAMDNDDGQTESAVSSFWTNSVNSAPTEITLLTPASGEETDLTPNFSWTESSDADINDEVSYILSYGSDVNMMESMSMGTDLSYTVETDLMDNTEYLYQSQAILHMCQ